MCSGSLWKELQADEATWSSRSRHQLVSDSSHYVQFDRPNVVIKAVNKLFLRFVRINSLFVDLGELIV